MKPKCAHRPPPRIACFSPNITAGGRILGERRRPSAGLLGVRWRRVILDEAHSIRNTDTNQVRCKGSELNGSDSKLHVLCENSRIARREVMRFVQVLMRVCALYIFFASE